MQLTGDRFTSASALFGNDLATLPDFPAEIRAPAGTLAGVSAFQVHISDHEITTPGDAPNVLVAMNPAALKAELAPARAGRHAASSTPTPSTSATSTKAGYAANPLERRQPRRLHGLRGADDQPHQGGGRADLGVKPRDAERSKNFFALGLVSWMYTRPVEPTLDVDREPLQPQRRWSATPTLAAFKAGHAFGETAELFDHPYRGAARPSSRRAPTRTSPATPRWRGAWSPPASWPSLPLFLGSLPDHAGVGHPPRAVQAQELRRPHAAGRGRDRRHRLGARRRLRRPPRRHHHQRPRHRPQGRDDRPGRQPRAAAAHHRHPAGRARPPACRPRPRRPTCCRRCTAATASRPLPDRGRLQPVALLRRGHRGGPHRAQVPHAGDPAVRRLPGQRLRAVAAARRSTTCPTSRCRSPPSPTTPTPTATPSSGPTSATPRPWPGPGRCPARPGSCTASAASRRRTAPATSPTTPANHERMVHLRADEGRRHRQRHPACRGRRRRRRRRAPRARLGLDLGRDRRRGRPRAGPRGQQGGPRPPRAPQPVPPEPGRGAAALPAGARARDEPRPARASWCGPSTSSTPSRSPRSRACRSPPASSKPPSSRNWETDRDRHRCAAADHPQGLDQRPGGPLVPGLRRLLDPHRRAAAHARARRAPREHRVRVGHRLRRPLPVLHEHLRDALDPRPGAGHRHRPGHGPARPRRVGRRAATATCCRSAATT